MPYFALMYDVVDNFADQRMPFRPAHLQEVKDAKARGELVMAGALGEPAGALLIFRAADKSVTYGDPAPALTYTVTGYVNGDDQSAFTGSPALATAYTTSSPAGTPVAITAAAGTLASANYA